MNVKFEVVVVVMIGYGVVVCGYIIEFDLGILFGCEE